jgi:transcriptional regulator with XRE-family HTH domain
MKRNPELNQVTTLFGKLLNYKRTKAGLSLPELSELTCLPCELLNGYEDGSGGQPTFDTCYKIAMAINSREMQGFTIQELWEAASTDSKIRAAQFAA